MENENDKRIAEIEYEIHPDRKLEEMESKILEKLKESLGNLKLDPEKDGTIREYWEGKKDAYHEILRLLWEGN